MQSGTKNPPWARSNVNSTNITGINPQIMDPNAMAMSQQGILPFQQSQTVFNANMMQAQSGMTMPLTGQMPMNQMAQGQMYPGNVVAYPTPRAMNPGMYQNAQSSQPQGTPNEQRVFTGTVTKTHNDFGFVDQDVFYQTSVCAKGIIPKVNERVLVEAVYNPNMPFKWNATRVQVLPKSSMSQNKPGPKSNTYNAVPPPQGGKKPMMNRRDERPPRRDDRPQHQHRKIYPVDKKQQETPQSFQKRSRSRSRSRSPRRESRRRDSPPRKRPATHQPSPVKYVVRVPRMPLEISTLDVPTVFQRYTNLYIPSDFFSASVTWGETFPPENSFPLNNPCSYHIMSKEVENPVPNDAVIEPPDADYRYSAKVMLINLPPLEALYQKCGLMKCDDKDKRGSKSPLHPTRLIKFLVGQKGKGGEHFAIGGPWSPSLDGAEPEADPTVLIRTAIRTCKALTGIDLSAVTEWYRVVEFNYWRARSGARSERVERVALVVPGRAPAAAWPAVQQRYARAAADAVRALYPHHTIETEPTADDSTITIDETDEVEEVKADPTHYSKLDMKTIKVEQLKQELAARNASCKGLRHTLVARLKKLLKAEENKEKNGEEVMELDEDEQNQGNDESKDAETTDDLDKTVDKETEDKTETADKTEEGNDKPAEKPKEKTEKEIEEEKKKMEKDIQQIKARYELPSTPHVIVHPSTTAKGGKFNCTVASLSLLLDYRVSDNKEHSFELFVFAELFNEMLMRDFGFYIYKTLYTLPERVEEKEEKQDKDKKEEKQDKDKKEDNKDKEPKKDDKRDEKRDSRKRERKDSHSDDERSSSPSTKSCGVELPADPYLLLSLVYFDTGRGGQIGKKDLQNLFMSLGLKLSRAQVRTVLDKVCVKDYFNYKSLMQSIKDISSASSDVAQDIPIDTPVTEPEVSAQISELEAMIAAGNRELLKPKKTTSSDESSKEPIDVSDTGLVVYKSRVVEVGALVGGLARSQAQAARLEAALGEARAVARTMRSAAAKTQAATRHAQAQLHDVTAQLAIARGRVVSLTASSKIFHSALKSIQSKVEAVVNIKYEDDDVVEVVNGPSKVEKKEPKAEVTSTKDDPVKKEERLKGKETEVKQEETEAKNNKTSEAEDKKDTQDKNEDSQDKNADLQDQNDDDDDSKKIKDKNTDMDVDKE